MNKGGVIGGSLKLKGLPPISQLSKKVLAKPPKDKNEKKSHKKDKKKHKKHHKRSSSSDSSDQGKKQTKPNPVQSTPVIAEEKKKETTEQDPKQPEIPSVHMTESERRYIEVQRQRQKQRIEQKLSQTHREKIDEFNQKLSKLPEHFDIPKVGPG